MSLRSVQVLGIATKSATLALGVVQTAIVLRLLGPEGYGTASVVLSVGTLVGVTQHVGAVEAAIREVAVAGSPPERAAVFWVSLWLRLAATVPLSLILAVGAPWVGRLYENFPIVPGYLRVMSVVLVAQGIQGIMGAAYSGARAFGRLYTLQLCAAVLNLPLVAGLVWSRGVRGFFEAMLVGAVLFSFMLAWKLRRALGGSLRHPNGATTRRVFRDVVGTGVPMYLSRMLGVAWQRLPLLVLGLVAPPVAVGLFSAAQTFAGKLVLLTQALGEVNLAFLSNAYARARGTFRALARQTLTDVGAVVVIATLVLVLLSDVLVRAIAGAEYLSLVSLFPAVVFGTAAYTFLDLATNTLFAPAGRARWRVEAFVVLVLATLLALADVRAAPLIAAARSVLVGGVAGLLIAVLRARSALGVFLFPPVLFLPVVGSVVLAGLAGRLSLGLRVFLLGGFVLAMLPTLVWRRERTHA